MSTGGKPSLILTATDELIERRLQTRRERFAAELGTRAPAQVLLEASTESEWVAACLEALGHTVIVADPNCEPMYPERRRRVKTNRRDAASLARACRQCHIEAAHTQFVVLRNMPASTVSPLRLIDWKYSRSPRASISMKL